MSSIASPYLAIKALWVQFPALCPLPHPSAFLSMCHATNVAICLKFGHSVSINCSLLGESDYALCPALHHHSWPSMPKAISGGATPSIVSPCAILFKCHATTSKRFFLHVHKDHRCILCRSRHGGQLQIPHYLADALSTTLSAPQINFITAASGILTMFCHPPPPSSPRWWEVHAPRQSHGQI